VRRWKYQVPSASDGLVVPPIVSSASLTASGVAAGSVPHWYENPSTPLTVSLGASNATSTVLSLDHVLVVWLAERDPLLGAWRSIVTLMTAVVVLPTPSTATTLSARFPSGSRFQEAANGADVSAPSESQPPIEQSTLASSHRKNSTFATSLSGLAIATS
jgi:hypothetical protein